MLHKDSESYFLVNLRNFPTPLVRSFDLIQYRNFHGLAGAPWAYLMQTGHPKLFIDVF